MNLKCDTLLSIDCETHWNYIHIFIQVNFSHIQDSKKVSHYFVISVLVKTISRMCQGC